MSDGEIKYSDLIQGIPERRFIRARDVKRLVTRLNKLSLIMQVSRSLMGAIDVKKLLSEILNKACVVMNAYRASVFLIDEEANEIYASVTLDGSEIRLPRGSGIIGFVADTGETVNIPDAYADARFNRANDARTGFRTKSILCMAVRDKTGKVTGALQILNKLDGDFFTAEDEEMLAAFTAMAGICLENARAYEELAAERNSLEDKVVERTAELAMAKAETDQILRAVEEGLFLLYQARDNFIIGAEHSQALASIFEQDELRSKNFLTAIAAFLPPETVDKTRTFIELMFDPTKKQAMLLKLNPLTFVQANFAAAEKQKYLRFSFNRITQTDGNGKVTSVDHLMATVSDVTHEIELRQKLERTEAQNRRHNELLLAILQSEPGTLAEFLNDLGEDLEAAQRLFEEAQESAGTQRRALLTEIFRVMHSVKGNSSLLNFQHLTTLAHSAETNLDDMIPRDAVADADIKKIGDAITELKALNAELRAWLEKIAVFQTAGAGSQKTDFLLRTLENALLKAAASQGKKVALDTQNFSAGKIPPEHRKAVKDLLMHLVRNSAIHGIEPSADRMAQGKPAEGRVCLSSADTDGRLTIVLEDDGRGIDTAGIARKLLQRGVITEAELNSMSDAEKARLIFRAGVSTQEGVTEFAGRGMGMNIVEENARKMDGAIDIETQPGHGTKFVMRLG
ncbi:MAG: GAF domain-containing protein [Turneriella sp.]|nr:GAF domain-containing protein [Turneriella sp.]